MNFNKLLNYINNLRGKNIFDDWQELYKELEIILSEYSEQRLFLTSDEEKDSMYKFQNIFFPYIKQSEFGKYIIERPRGYVGDFISQEMIWNARTNGFNSKFRGTSEIGKALNFLTMEMDNPKANEERIYILKGLIKKAAKRIASIGCGSAIELWNNNDAREKEIFLLDFDEGALNRAKEKLNPYEYRCVKYHKDNILKFILNKDNDRFPKQDLIYVFGLCDYFNLKNSQKIVTNLWRYVDNGGNLVITNASIENKTRLWMEWGGNWLLDYKSKDELFSLTKNIEGIADMVIMRDKYSVYQYLVIKKH